MSTVERFEDEGTKKLDPRLTLRLFGYLRPYRVRASVAVLLVILSSFTEVAGPAIVAIAFAALVSVNLTTSSFSRAVTNCV